MTTIPNKQIHIIAGGTSLPIAPHLSICAEAFGTVGHQLKALCEDLIPQMDTTLHLTRMAGGGDGAPRSNSDVEHLLKKLVSDTTTRVIIMPVALCDFEPQWFVQKDKSFLPRNKDVPRIRTKDGEVLMKLVPAKKLLPTIRNGGPDHDWPVRKDIFLVGFSTTADANETIMYRRGLEKLKNAGANLILANDIHTGAHCVIAPEETFYHLTHDRRGTLQGLVEMIALRTHLTFTRSSVVAGEPISWFDARVPHNLRRVVDHMIARTAYKAVGGKTAGHFAVKVDDTTFLTSRRKSNFNLLEKTGLVLVTTDAPDTTMLYGSESVTAYGGKPSVGGQSQRIVFKDHPGYDCIVHAHIPMRPGSLVPVRSQREYECGSHECGKNTSNGLKEFAPGLKAVMLDGHGPNIVFKRDVSSDTVIKFIEDNFDLTQKTGMQAWDGVGEGA